MTSRLLQLLNNGNEVRHREHQRRQRRECSIKTPIDCFSRVQAFPPIYRPFASLSSRNIVCVCVFVCLFISPYVDVFLLRSGDNLREDRISESRRDRHIAGPLRSRRVYPVKMAGTGNGWQTQTGMSTPTPVLHMPQIN